MASGGELRTALDTGIAPEKLGELLVETGLQRVPLRLVADVREASGPNVINRENGVRRVVIGFELARSTLGPDVAFPVLMANALDYLTLRADAEIAVHLARA